MGAMALKRNRTFYTPWTSPRTKTDVWNKSYAIWWHRLA